MPKQNENLDMETMQHFKKVFDMAIGAMKSQVISAAAELKIADFLKDAPKGIDEIAEHTGTNSSALYRLLRALDSIGIFNENNDGLFELTPMASVLLSDLPVSLRSFAMLTGERAWWNSWGKLLYSVKTGKPSFDRVFGMDFVEYLEKNPGYADTFNECMTSVSIVNNPGVVESYNFSDFNKIVDVGGGQGSLLSAILEANEGVTGILFERPQMIRSLNNYKIGDCQRIECIGGDFFRSVPDGGDVYILKQIIHDWSDDLCVKILQNCKKAMVKKGRILVVEAVIETGNADEISNLFDLHMLVTSEGGKERSAFEFESLFRKAGFELTRIIKTPTSINIIEGQKR